MPDILGLHHVTAIAGDPQQNVDFYAGVLGLRLVKLTLLLPLMTDGVIKKHAR
jgi:glyoxalase family protein